MRKTAKITLGLGVALFLLGMMAGCGRKTETADILTDTERYIGKEVIVEGEAYHNLFDIQKYQVELRRYQEYAKRNSVRGYIPPVPPEEFSIIGGIEAKYEVSPPEVGRMIRATGIIKLKENLVPIIVVKSWKYIQSPKEKTREKYKEHIVK